MDGSGIGSHQTGMHDALRPWVLNVMAEGSTEPVSSTRSMSISEQHVTIPGRLRFSALSPGLIMLLMTASPWAAGMSRQWACCAIEHALQDSMSVVVLSAKHAYVGGSLNMHGYDTGSLKAERGAQSRQKSFRFTASRDH